MWTLILATVVFIFSHIIPSHGPIRASIVARMGERLFMSVYGAISLFLFVWLIYAYLNAPYIDLWDVGDIFRAMSMGAMFFVCVFLVCAFSQPNPFSLGRGGKGFNPDKPGIIGLMRHPAFMAFFLWSLAHILSNGDVASLIFFGLMAVLSLYGPLSLDRRRKAEMGKENWSKLVARTKKGWPVIGFLRLIGAIVLFIALFYLHEPVIGVQPFYW